MDTGETLTVSLNERGIINKIEGSMEEFAFTETIIREKGKGEYEIELGGTFINCIYHNLFICDDGVLVVSTDLDTGEKYKNKITFGNKDYLVKDDFMTIKLNSPTSFESVFNPRPKTVLPRIKFEDNTAYEGGFSMEIIYFKYEYLLNNGKYQVILYEPMPEDGWFSSMKFNIGNIKSENQIVNLVNSIIINLHNESFGCIIFPILMGDFVK